LITFVQKHEDFRLPELEAILKMQGLDPASTFSRDAYRKDLPYLVAFFPTEAAAAAVCDRAILIKSVMELWGEAATHDELAAATKDLPAALVDPHLGVDVSWSVTVDAFGMSMSMERQEEVRAHYRHVAFQGPVQCKDPDQMFWVLEQHTPLPTGQVPSGSTPEKVYFGREVARSSSRRLVTRCDLKRRKYLGPTSMDNELSLVMANMGLVRKGSVVLDPFVGTGSILVACANFGAFCFGTDIDTRVLRGKGDSNIFSNFDQ
jgi:tRNA (guanine10-N2)-methyltransferase